MYVAHDNLHVVLRAPWIMGFSAPHYACLSSIYGSGENSGYVLGGVQRKGCADVTMWCRYQQHASQQTAEPLCMETNSATSLAAAHTQQMAQWCTCLATTALSSLHSV